MDPWAILEQCQAHWRVQIKDRRWAKLAWNILNNDFNHSLSLPPLSATCWIDLTFYLINIDGYGFESNRRLGTVTQCILRVSKSPQKSDLLSASDAHTERHSTYYRVLFAPKRSTKLWTRFLATQLLNSLLPTSAHYQ